MHDESCVVAGALAVLFRVAHVVRAQQISQAYYVLSARCVQDERHQCAGARTRAIVGQQRVFEFVLAHHMLCEFHMQLVLRSNGSVFLLERGGGGWKHYVYVREIRT